MFWRKYLWVIIYGMLLCAFTVYILLDTFVITKVYTVVQSESDDSSGEKTDYTKDIKDIKKNRHSKKSITEQSEETSDSVSEVEYSYDDGTISIDITEYREFDSSIYVADVRIASAEYLRTAFAEGAYGKNVTEKTSEIAQNNGAILAINGDFYGAQEKGYVLRNGVVYRNTSAADREDLVIYEDGSFDIVMEDEIPAEQLLAEGARQVLSFGPALVLENNISVTEEDEVGKAKTSNPRTAIGMIDDLHYLFVVSDGRTEESEGLSLYELAEFMQSLGAVTAYNLDGGGSSTMYFKGELINNPTTNGKSIKERSVSDIVYIGY